MYRAGNDSIPDQIEEMLNAMGIQNEQEELSLSQQKAFDIFKSGENLLILGEAGTGKSLLLKTISKYIKKSHPKKVIAITSTTGVSAFNISGVTIHSFAGIGTGSHDTNILINRIFRNGSMERLIKLDILVIDEISMLSAELFEKLNIIFQSVRRNNKFFGGVQLIFTGDFLQLIAIFNKNLEIYKDLDTRLIVESDIFNEIFTPLNTVVLKENFRQKNDQKFINILNNIREGVHTKEDIKVLNTRKILPEKNNKSVFLVSSNRKASEINSFNLNKIKSKSYFYKAIYKTDGEDVNLCEILKKDLEKQFKERGVDELELKKNTRVMLTKNINTEIGLVNGAIGFIDSIRDSGIIYVKFDNGILAPIEKELQVLEVNSCKATAFQVPLMLAFAITIHRSQSLSLDSAILDLSDCFCDHQVYVALSRVRSLDGIYLLSFNPKKIKVNLIMKKFLDKLK